MNMTISLSATAITRTIRVFAALRLDPDNDLPPELDPDRGEALKGAIDTSFYLLCARLGPYVTDIPAPLVVELSTPRAMDATDWRQVRRQMEETVALCVLEALHGPLPNRPGDPDDASVTAVAAQTAIAALKTQLRPPVPLWRGM